VPKSHAFSSHDPECDGDSLNEIQSTLRSDNSGEGNHSHNRKIQHIHAPKASSCQIKQSQIKSKETNHIGQGRPDHAFRSSNFYMQSSSVMSRPGCGIIGSKASRTQNAARRKQKIESRKHCSIYGLMRADKNNKSPETGRQNL
jgi:hypothetical protein